MSDISNSNEQTTIEINMQGNAQQGAAELSAQIVNLSQQLATLSQRAVQNANVTKAFNQSMGLSISGVSQYSREISQSLSPLAKMTNAVEMQKRVLDEATKSATAYSAAQRAMQNGSLDPNTLSRSNAAMSQSVTHIKAMKTSSDDLQKAMKQVALLDYSKRISDNAVKSQQAAYNFSKNFSMPLILGLREAFFSYSKLATESNRTTKLVLDNFAQLNTGGQDGLDKQVNAAKKFTAELGKELDKITRDWGTSRVLIQSLAGDFAELGISSSTVLSNLTRMTAETEKLGNLDISQSSEFIQSMYQTILRLRRETGKSVDIGNEVVANEIITQLKGQLAVFNLIENKTVMSLRNIADAFPEVTAAATSFGLSMTEATALILPMVASGFQVGASANSMKVSLQRMVAMTKQNTQILSGLHDALGKDFEYSAGIGMHNIQQLSDAYGNLVKDVSKGGKGKQGALELFSRLFGVRQGPRMETAIAQLNAFQKQLDTTGTTENTVAKQLQSSVNEELRAIGQKQITIKKFEDLSTIHRMAIEKDSKDILTVQALAIQRGQIKAQALLEKNKKGNSDFISGMSTEVGKALMAQAFDVNKLAGTQFEAELKLSQDTPEVRYRRAKESLMALGRAVVPVVDTFLKGLLPVLEKLASFLQNNPFIAKLVSALLGVVALSGPLRMVFTTLKTAFGSTIGLFVKLSRIINGTTLQFASLQDLIMNPNLLRGQQRVVQYMDGFLIKSKRGAKELKEAYDFSGISLPAKEAIIGGGIYGSDKAVNMKRLQPYVPQTNQLMNDLKVIQAQGTAQMVAGVANASEEGVAKGTTNLADDIAMKFATVMHKFQGPNLFAGPNYFEGNIPGGGISGGPGSTGTPRTPRAPRGSSGAIADNLTAEETVAAVAANEARKARLRPPTITNYPKGTLFPSSTAKSFNDLEKTLNSIKKRSGSLLFSPANAAAGAVQAVSSSIKPQQAFNPAQLLSNISKNRIALGRDPLGPVAIQRFLSKAGDNAKLSFDQIREWYVQAGKPISDQLEYAFSKGGIFTVSKGTLDAVKTKIFDKTKQGIFTLATGEGGVDKRIKGLASIRGFRNMGKKVQTELVPVIASVSDSIAEQVNVGLNQSLATLNELKLDSMLRTPMGATGGVINDLTAGKPVLIDDIKRAIEDHFIAAESITNGVVRQSSTTVVNSLKDIDKLLPNIVDEIDVIANEAGPLSSYGDDLRKAFRNVRAKTHRFVESVNASGQRMVTLVKNEVLVPGNDGQLQIKAADEAARRALGSGTDALDAEKAAERAKKIKPDYIFNQKVDKARLQLQKLREAKVSALSRVTSVVPPLPTTEPVLVGRLAALDEAIKEQNDEIQKEVNRFKALKNELNSVVSQEADLQNTKTGKSRVRQAGKKRLQELQEEHDYELNLLRSQQAKMVAERNRVLNSPAAIQRQINDTLATLPKDVKAAVQDVDKAVSDEMKQLAMRSESRVARMKRAIAGIGKTTNAAIPMNPMLNAIPSQIKQMGSDGSPLDVFKYKGSRFFNDRRFSQPNARMFDAQRGLSLPTSIKSFFGMDRVKGVFKAPKSLSAAAVTHGEQIIFQFADQLEAQLGSVLSNTAQADIKHITRVLQNLKPTSVSKDLAAFMTGIVNLPQDQIEMAMGNTLTEIKRAVTGQTGAGVGGKGMKSGSLQSWKAFLERMRRGSQGLDTDASGNPIVKGIREFFFSGKIKKGAINTTSAKGISAALESAFVASMKGGFLGLGGKDDAGVSEVGRRLTVESNRPGLSRQRSAKKALKDAGKKATEAVKGFTNDIEGFLTAPAAVMADIASKVDMVGAKSSSMIKAATDKVMKPIVKVYKPGELFPGRAPSVIKPQAIAPSMPAITAKGLEHAGVIAPTTKKQAEKMIELAQKELARQLGIDAQASGASAKIKKLSALSFEKEIQRIQAMIAGEEQALKTFTSPGMRKGPEKRLTDLNKQMQKLTEARDKYIVAEAKLAEIASVVTPLAPSSIIPTGTTGGTAPTAPPPRIPIPTTPVIPTPVTPPATGGAGKIFNIDKIGHRFQGPNIFSDNIFSTNLQDVIPNFDELMAMPAADAGASIAAAGQTAGAAISEGAAAMQAAAGSINASNVTSSASGAKQSLASRVKSKLFGAKGLPQLTGKEDDFAKILENNIGKKILQKKLKIDFDKSGAIIGITKIKKLGGEMAISLDRANSILAGRLLPNFTRLKKLFSSSIIKGWVFALTGGLSAAVKPAKALMSALTATGETSMRGKAQSAIKNLVESRGPDKKTGIVRKAMAGLSGATGGINSLAAAGSKAADIMFKIGSAIAMIGTVAVIALPIIVLIFGIFQAWKNAQGRLATTTEALKKSLTNLKDAVVTLFAPLRDMVNGFLGATSIGGTFMTQGEKNASMFLGIANAIKKATASIKKWAETTGKAFMTNQVAPFLTRLINRFILLGGAIKSAFSGDKEAAGKKLKAFLYSLIYELLNFTRGITDIVALILKGLIPVLIAIAKIGVVVFREMFKALVGMAADAGAGIARNLAGDLLTGGLGKEYFKYIGDPFAGFVTGNGWKIQGDKSSEQFSDGFSTSLSAKLTGLIEPIKGGLDSALSNGMSEIGKKYAELMGQGINVPLAQRLKNPKAFKEALAYSAKKSADAATSAGESLGSNVANGVKDKMKEIKDTLKGYFYSNVDAKFDSIIQQYTDALNKQKDEQLKAYDDQIAGIDALADAEARLTAKKEYETKRRELIDQRATDHENYQVERRLAVYEGRAFDVRKLDREEVLSQRDSNQQIQGLDSDRLSQLQSEQRDLAKQVIANQKDLAEKQFQEVLDSFDRFIEDVKNKSFATQEEFAAALKKVGEQANISSSDLAKVFAKNIGEIPAIIAGVRDPSIKMFSANMDDLIKEASKKFGIDNKIASPSTVLGAVRMMAIGSEEGFKAAFNPVFATTYVQPAVDAIAKVTSSLSEKGNKNNIADIWQKAGTDAFDKLKGELNRDIAFPKILDSFKNLITDLKPLVAQVVALAGGASAALSNIGDNGTQGYIFTNQDRADLAKYLVKYAPTDAASREKLALNAPSVQRVVQVIADNYDKGSEFLQANIAKFGLSGLEKVLLQAYLNSQMIGVGSPTLMRALPGQTITKYNGGAISQYVRGGFLEAPASQGIPALLHGGEYIINHKAVERFGRGNLERINALRHGGDLKGFASGGYMTTPGFANGGYMTTPGFANGGYMTAPGFARGGAVRRRPKDSEPINPGDDSSLRTFTNKRGESYTIPNVNIRSGKATGTTMHMLDWASIARSESGPDWMNALGATTKTSRGVFVGPLNIARKTWQIYSNAYKKQTGVDVGNFNNPNATPSWQDQVKIAEMVAFNGIPDSPYEYYRQPKFLDGFEGVRKNKVFFQPFSELKAFDKTLGFANGGTVRKPKRGGSAGSIYDFDYRGAIPDRIEDKLRVKGIPSSRIQIPKEQDPNSRRRGRITPIIPPEKRYPQDGSYEVEAPWAGYTNKPDLPWKHHEGGGADRQPQMTTWKDHIGEPVGSFGFPVRYRHILGYYPTDRIPLGGKKGEDVSIVWDGKNRWTRSDSGVKKYLGGMIPQFKLGGFLKPGFGLPNLKGFNPLSWLFGKKGKDNNQNQTMFTDKPKFSIKKEPWKTYLKNQLKFFPDKTEQQITEELYAEYSANLEENGSQEVTLPVPQYIKNMPLQLAMENDSVNKIGQIARGGVVQRGLTENGLIMRAIKKIYVSPEYWNEKELFRNDGDSIWRKAANRTTKDNVITNHMSMLELHKGVSAAMDSLSQYLNIPYQFTYGPKQFGVIPTIKDLKKSMVLDVFGNFDPNSGFSGYTYSDIKTPSPMRSNASVKEAIRQASNYSSISLNTALANKVDNGTPYYGTEEWSQVFMHEFGHIGGGFDHPHEYIQALSRKFDGSSSTNKMLNSIMSYDTNGGKITRQLRPTDINAYKEVMGFSLSPASIIRRLDANKNIFNSQSSVNNERRPGSGYMLDLINKKKQLPKVKKFEQGGFIGPMLPKKKKNFWGKVAGIGKGAFNIGKEILRPKNSFAIAGGTLAAILATPGGPAAMVAAGMAGSAAGGGIGSFVEQAFDKKKGFQPLDIGKNMLLQGAMYGLGAGAGAIGERFIMPALAKYGTPALRGMGDVAMNKLGLAGMDAAEIPGLIKAGVSYTKSKVFSFLGKGVSPLAKAVSKVSPYAGDYLQGLKNSWRKGELDLSGNPLRNYQAPVKGFFKNIFRSDNIAIREAREKANAGFYEEYVRLNKKPPTFFNGRPTIPLNPVPPSNLFPYNSDRLYQPGPLTRILNKVMKFNPFGKKIGIHVGRSGIKDLILPQEIGKRTGPDDTLSGYTYAWLKGSAERIANAAKSFAIQQEYGLQTGLRGLSDPGDASFYITKMKGIFDPNVMFSRARMSKSQKILQELPITSSLEELTTALTQYRENTGIRGVFNKVRSNIARLRNYITGESIYLHSSPTQGLDKIKPFAGAAIGNKDPLAFLKKATMQPDMTEESWKYTGNSSANARAGWGKIRGTISAPAPGGSVYVVRGPKGMPSSSSFFDDVDPNSFVSKNSLKVLSEIKIPNSFTQEEALAYVDAAVRRSVTRFGGPKTPRFKKGGYLKFKEGGEVPSILHGGEYVLNAGAVKKYGLAHLEAMNQMKFNVPSAGFSVPQAAYSGSAAGGMTTSTQNVNIYVDNFIGEPEWFNSMMKDYNTKILPKNQKAAGLENRVISTYNGLNRGQ